MLRDCKYRNLAFDATTVSLSILPISPAQEEPINQPATPDAIMSYSNPPYPLLGPAASLLVMSRLSNILRSSSSLKEGVLPPSISLALSSFFDPRRGTKRARREVGEGGDLRKQTFVIISNLMQLRFTDWLHSTDRPGNQFSYSFQYVQQTLINTLDAIHKHPYCAIASRKFKMMRFSERKIMRNNDGSTRFYRIHPTVPRYLLTLEPRRLQFVQAEEDERRVSGTERLIYIARGQQKKGGDISWDIYVSHAFQVPRMRAHNDFCEIGIRNNKVIRTRIIFVSG